MPNVEIERRLRQITQSFVADVLNAFRLTFSEVVGGGDLSRDVEEAPLKANREAAPAARGRGRRIRRSAGETSQIIDQVEAFVRTRAKGAQVGDIGKALGKSTKELMLPIGKALAAGRLSKKGQRRSTVYFATGKARK